MKKVILLVLSLVLALACAVSSFAYYGIVTWDEASAEGKLVGNSLNDGNIQSAENKIRNDWTASRGMPQENATFVDLDGNTAVKITGTEYITSDNALKGKAFVTVDLKVVNPGTFCGLVIDCEKEEGYGSSTNTVFEATHGSYILYSGYGFTIKDKNTIVAFVNASATGSVDAKELTLDFDASADFHTYSIFRDEDAKKSYLMVDSKVIAIFDFSLDADHVGIYSADGKEMYANTNNNWKDGNIWFAVVGTSEVYLDNIGYNDKAPEGAYLMEPAAEGKTDILAGVKGKYICNANMTEFNGEEITLLTDGVIAANKAQPLLPLNRIHLNDQWTKSQKEDGKTVKFAGVDKEFCYAVEFEGLMNVSFDSFDIYFSSQNDAPWFNGSTVNGGRTEKNLCILYSQDGGKTYAVAYDSSVDPDGVISNFGDDQNKYITKVAGDDFVYRTATRTFTKVTKVTNIVYASPEGKGNEWPSATSELSIWGTTEDPAYPGYVGASFDSINFNGTQNFGGGDGKASEKMQPIDGTKGDIESVNLRGWAGFDQAITAFGYRINGTDTFVDGKDFKINTEDAVRLPENGGANGSRFSIDIPTAGLKGVNTIVAIVKLADGKVIALDDQFDAKITAAAAVSPNTTFVFNGPAEGGNKPTSDVAVAFAVVAVAAMAVVVLKKRETI